MNNPQGSILALTWASVAIQLLTLIVTATAAFFAGEYVQAKHDREEVMEALDAAGIEYEVNG